MSENLSDGMPTDDYKKGLNKLKALPWFKKAVKIAISIGKDAEDDIRKISQEIRN